MSLVNIDHELCNRDGKCMAVCPSDLFQKDSEGYLEFRQQDRENCIGCGHCVAVCETSALRHESLPVENYPPIGSLPLTSAPEVVNLLKSRRSVREFRNTEVPDALLEETIDAARWAPSAVNQQPSHWLVIRDRDELRRLAGLIIDGLRKARNLGPVYSTFVERWDRGEDPILRNAPCLVVVHASDKWPWSPVDCVIALSQFELAARAKGLGCCWSGFLMKMAREFPPVKEALRLPEGHGVHGALMVGWPRYAYHRFPPRVEARITWR